MFCGAPEITWISVPPARLRGHESWLGSKWWRCSPSWPSASGASPLKRRSESPTTFCVASRPAYHRQL